VQLGKIINWEDVNIGTDFLMNWKTQGLGKRGKMKKTRHFTRGKKGVNLFKGCV